MTPRPQMIRMNISSSQSKSRYETYLVDISPRSSPQLVADSWWLVAKSSLSKGSISLQPRGSRSERRSFLRDIHLETAGAQTIVAVVVVVRSTPDRSNFHLVRVLSHLRRLAALFFHVRFHDLGCDTRGELAVLPAFKQDTDHEFRIAAR